MKAVWLHAVSSDANSTNSQHGRRLSGGGNLVHHGVSTKVEFHISSKATDSKALELVLQTNCPSIVATAVDVFALGAIGKAQVWIAFFLLILVLFMILIEVLHRTLVAFAGAASVIFVLALEHRLPAMSTVVLWMDHGTLALLWGMMVIVALLAKTGLFEWCAVRVFERSGGSTWKLYAMLMVFCAFISAFLDNVTTILLLGPVIIPLCKAIEIDPKPMLISLALFGNIGGAATMIGDPPNIIIGNAFSSEISFLDFLLVMGPAVVLLVPCALIFARWYFGKSYFSRELSVDIEKLKKEYPIRDTGLLIKASAVLSACILLFFLHPVTHLDPAYVACWGAVLLLIMADHHDFEYAIAHVEWDSLLFFAGLFVFTEGLAELGLLREIANVITWIIESVPIESRQTAAIVIVQLISTFASAFVDNIPFTTTMIPVLRQTAANVEGISLKPMIWALAFGADLGGLGTLIGASANVVMSGIAGEAGHHVSFMEFFKVGFPLMCMCAFISCSYLLVLQAAGLLA
eukprot:TRINITY_DN18118_c0_g1_i3.p1 TRINITY_DN18118_c0_g1~~TRINITY_DN18118_c0_g1_i3.p1  ORF type:complete len:564 (-),score=65.70 TRINITY_DN18118_c0_g1_i3:30-1586(-)